MGNVRFYPAVLDNMLHGRTGDVGVYLSERAEIAVGAAKLQAGFDTGRLRYSIHYRLERRPYGQDLRISANVPHALLHHEGTKPHVILPRNSPHLRFSTGGRMVYARSVMHPGTRPNRYLSDQIPTIINP